MANRQIPVSVLNLVPVREGQGAKEVIDQMVDLAQATEKMGYTRYWIAEHHNTPSIVSSATSILIKHTLEHTQQIRVGSGGVMLPNHSPLVVAEQFGTMMVCLNVIAAESDEEAKFEWTTTQQFFLNVVRGSRWPLLPPVESMDDLWSPQEKLMASSMLSMAFLGSKDSIREQFNDFQEKYNVDEIMVVTYMYN